MNLRTVQRVLAAGRPAPAKSENDVAVRRFMVALRNFATYCRENPADQVALLIPEGDVEKVRERAELIRAWLRRLDEEPEG